MNASRYANRIVMRRDFASGLVMVGYATEMPLERFEHLEDICATDDGARLHAGNPHYPDYESACERARAANAIVIQQRAEQARRRGWIRVPLELNSGGTGFGPDKLGSYRGAAMAALFRLCGNDTEVWAVINNDLVTHVHARHPTRPMEALEFAVWKRYWLRELSSHPGEVCQGRLVADESGLWLCRSDTPPT